MSNVCIFPGYAKNVTTTAGALVLTGSQVYCPTRIYSFTNVGATNVTTPTAVALAAAHRTTFGSLSVNDTYTFALVASNAGTILTVVPGAGVTNVNGIAAGPAGVSLRIKIVYTNVTLNAETCNIFVGYGF